MSERWKTRQDLKKEYEKTEDGLKAMQSVSQIIAEILKQLDDDRFIVKASSGPRYVVSFHPTLPLEKPKAGTQGEFLLLGFHLMWKGQL
ncbi:hypothetical protein BS47DRAFT_1399623 [Hydnum rufescens UP504]|uniref:Proteasomal ATPase second OB domain-containing protein n=1 Tax=Hydnum rufescens UP504 TaxID=1448309 RepID=A0A9P6DPI1_9AGAM|nr:hypothetical protein BS47DRAFT_1399623 [Hydnum rufescens UP504]